MVKAARLAPADAARVRLQCCCGPIPHAVHETGLFERAVLLSGESRGAGCVGDRDCSGSPSSACSSIGPPTDKVATTVPIRAAASAGAVARMPFSAAGIVLEDMSNEFEVVLTAFRRLGHLGGHLLSCNITVDAVASGRCD